VWTDDTDQLGMINTQIVDRVFEADLAAADLTHRNPTVLDELAIRHAAKKLGVHLVAGDEDIPLDVNEIRTMQSNLAVPNNSDRAREQWTEQAQALEKDRTTVIHRAKNRRVSLQSSASQRSASRSTP
jgi:hypothetical protein